MPGKPDIVFPGQHLAIFCDGDFWHGRDWDERLAKLSRGTNSTYWIAKIQRNMQRDKINTQQLEEEGWTVLRVWESDIEADTAAIVERVMGFLSSMTGEAPKEA